MEAKNNRRLLSLPFKWYLHDFTSVDSDCSLHSLWFGNPAKDGRKVKSNWKIVSMSVGYKFRSLKSNQNSAFPWFFFCVLVDCWQIEGIRLSSPEPSPGSPKVIGHGARVARVARVARDSSPFWTKAPWRLGAKKKTAGATDWSIDQRPNWSQLNINQLPSGKLTDY